LKNTVIMSSEPPNPPLEGGGGENRSSSPEGISKKAAAKQEELGRRLQHQQQEADPSTFAAINSSSEEEKEDPLAGNYGDVTLDLTLEVLQKVEVDPAAWTSVKELNDKLKDKVVVVQGWVQTKQVWKNMVFVVIKEDWFTVQCVVVVEAVSKKMVEFVAGLSCESFVEVHGVVSVPLKPIKKTTQPVELQVRKLYCIGKPMGNLPFNIADASRSEREIEEAAQKKVQLCRVRPETRQENRVVDLWTLTNQAIFSINFQVQNFLVSQGFVKIDTPSLNIAGSSEGGAAVFSLDYFGKPACLAQSPQLHKQMAICGHLRKVFMIGPVYRAEDSDTTRHLCQYTSLDVEMQIKRHYSEVIDLVDRLFVSIFDTLNEKCSEELEVVRKQYPFEPLKYLRKTLRLTFEEGVQMLKVDPKYSNSFDVFIRGQEIISGGQRIHVADLLSKRAEAYGGINKPPPPQPPPAPPSPTASSQSSSSSADGLRELECCVGRLEIARPKPVGFLCGSIPVPTDNSFHSFNSAALVPSVPQTLSVAPRYRMLPTETDLNALPVLQVPGHGGGGGGELPWEGESVSSSLRRKSEELAVSGLAEYGDEIDIFKIPYSKARLSIAVRRVGQTLVLNSGPDVEEGEKLVRRHSNQSKCADESLFLNFAMHSVRMEACDCPPEHRMSSKSQPSSSALPGRDTSQFVGESDDVTRNEGFDPRSEYTQVKQDGLLWGSKKTKRNKGRHPVKVASHLGEKPRCSVQESEKRKRVNNEGFLRVLFWQFHNFRMLLGSDLLLFSNEKYVAVSLHLWDITRQVTPLTWLEAWLDNVMASVPELAICYHENGVVQGYELLKTDDIFLLKGVAEDGTPAFHPHVVQQNGLSVLRFLQENCKQDPGAYWLYKSAGEDVIQLFDLSVIPKNNSSDDCNDSSTSVPSFIHRGQNDSFFSLGTLLYRIAHRLSLSMAPNNRARCANFLRKCLEFLDEPDLLVVRARAHEQFARLLLNYDEELGLTPESLSVEFEVTVPIESSDPFSSSSETVVYENVPSADAPDSMSNDAPSLGDIWPEASVKMTLEAHISNPRNLITLHDADLKDSDGATSTPGDNEIVAVSNVSPTSEQVVQAVADPISSKLAAVHHVSQAIKSLRWMRQLQCSESEFLDQDSCSYAGQPSSSINFSVCACGDTDCIEVCDIREWLPTSKIDHKLWKLVFLLGESYLALGQAYKEDNQLHQALKVVEVACSVYGSMPQHFNDDAKYPLPPNTNSGNGEIISCTNSKKEVKSTCNDDFHAFDRISSTYLFWAKAWTLVGDVYVEFYFLKGKELAVQSKTKTSTKELRMSSEVVKEVQRLKKKLGQYHENCSSCSLVNCSCQSDRVSSGSSASSSSGDKRSVAYGRRNGKRSYVRNGIYSRSGDCDDIRSHHTVESRKHSGSEHLKHVRDDDTAVGASSVPMDKRDICSMEEAKKNKLDSSLDMHDARSTSQCQIETVSNETPKPKGGGIFKYLGTSAVGDAEYNLTAALSCYQEARKALDGLSSGSAELQSLIRKVGWAYNEMGRKCLERKELSEAEQSFADAITAFREIADHTNIILTYCNLGHGRRALAEEMVSKIEKLKLDATLHKQAMQTAKLEYVESLRHYGAAKSEVDAISDDFDSLPDGLRNEVYTQFAHTYLRLGMLLAKEDISADVYKNGGSEDMTVIPIGNKSATKEPRRHAISANDAIREALSVYESLGELRKQEAAYAHFQLACYQRDSCLKFLEADRERNSLGKGESSILQRVKQYASLAERNWQKSMEFYAPKTLPSMHLTIIMERSALLLSLSSVLHSTAMLESALARMFEGRHVSENMSDSFGTDYAKVHAKFWGQLQMILKKMLAMTLAANTNKGSSVTPPTPPLNRHGDAGKLRELYKMSLKSSDLSQLHAMYTLWTS
ncbi:hypothetical protein Tsubulata_037913, partial [Turnera subulata]